jgi:hypothetical protein
MLQLEQLTTLRQPLLRGGQVDGAAGVMRSGGQSSRRRGRSCWTGAEGAAGGAVEVEARVELLAELQAEAELQEEQSTRRRRSCRRSRAPGGGGAAGGGEHRRAAAEREAGKRPAAERENENVPRLAGCSSSTPLLYQNTIYV